MDALIDLMQRWVVEYGYPAIFLLMLAESACIPFPSEVTMLVAGWYSATGDLNFFWAGAWGVLGNLVGSLIAYAVGRSTGRGLLDRYGRYVLIRSHDIDRAEVWWAKHGEAATFFSRLLPVIRTFISLPAGIARMPLGKFTLYTFLGVIPWTYALTYLGVVVEDNWEQVLGYFDVPTLIIGALLIAGAAIWYLRRRRWRRLPHHARLISGATSWRPEIEVARKSSRGMPSESSTPRILSRSTPGANDFSFSFFLTDDTFMPTALSGLTRAHATSRPATPSA
jgi:membrane protein DedA with SNARE-associated domain